MKEHNPIDELFKRGLENKEIKPSETVWDKIERETNQQTNTKRGGFYLMRAAAVTLLVGLSSMIYFSNNGGDVTTGITPDTGIIDHTPAEPEKKDGTATTKTETEPGKKKSTAKDTPKASNKAKKGTQKNKTKSNKIVPIIKNSKPANRYVSNTLPIADEEELVAAEPLLEMEEIETAPAKKKHTFKLKYRVPVTQKSFYADNATEEKNNTEKPEIKDKVYAYASNQFDNLISGKPLELPKVPETGKPHLEINLGALFKNN